MLCPGLSLAQETRSFEHWSLECAARESPEAAPCQLYQNVVLAREQGGGRVMRVSIGLVPGSKDPVALFVLPLGIALPPGIELEVAGGTPIRFPVERCELAGCGGGVRLDIELQRSLRNAERAVVRFRDGQRQPVSLELSLKGFGAGLDALTGP